MAIPVLLKGPSAAGKTSSIRTFDKTEAGVIAVEKERLPFKTEIRAAKVPETFPDARTAAQVHHSKYEWIMNVIRAAKCKSVIIDDSQYLLVNELFDRAAERGYDKYVEMASNFRNLVHFVNALPEEDKIVYFLHHTEIDSDGRAKAKTIGRMLDEKLVLEGCFDIVIYCQDHKFYTQSNGLSFAKTPWDMFPEVEIPNDLKAVDTAIRQYYGL